MSISNRILCPFSNYHQFNSDDIILNASIKRLCRLHKDFTFTLSLFTSWWRYHFEGIHNTSPPSPLEFHFHTITSWWRYHSEGTCNTSQLSPQGFHFYIHTITSWWRYHFEGIHNTSPPSPLEFQPVWKKPGAGSCKYPACYAKFGKGVKKLFKFSCF